MEIVPLNDFIGSISTETWQQHFIGLCYRTELPKYIQIISSQRAQH